MKLKSIIYPTIIAGVGLGVVSYLLEKNTDSTDDSNRVSSAQTYSDEHLYHEMIESSENPYITNSRRS